ncbi:MAG: alginate export family protein [Nitrospira sp.]|nr:hypothetical protein [Candidatus Manganitrophaceae bacterium]HIL34091.1 hypothetical protein [Candidatus Manganitrophaceae bacterium]
MTRRNLNAFILVLFYFIFFFPLVVLAESNDFKEGDVCRSVLLKDKRGRKGRGRWKECIALYKKTSAFEERKGRAAYEVARLYHLRALSSEKINFEDLKKAKRYYNNAIDQNKMKAGLIFDAKKLLRVVEMELVVFEEAVSKTRPIDRDAAPPLNFVVSPEFSVGGKLGFEVRERKNRDFNDARDDNDTRIETILSLAGLYQLGSGMELFGELEIKNQADSRPVRKGGNSRTLKGKFKTGYLLINRFMIPSMRLQLGRQRFKDSREWVFDEKLDAVRVFYRFSKVESQLSLSTNIIDPKITRDRIINLISYTSYRFGPKKKASFYFVNRRRKDLNLSLNFMGISLKGRPNKNLKTWLELGGVSGIEGPTDVSGYGFDLGASLRLRYPLKPYFTLGYAFGSGDKLPGDNKDNSFRQTGLQDNAAKLWGIARIKYYGELFDPELSNMTIITIGIGIRPIKAASVDLVYHSYSQVWTVPNQVIPLRNVGIKASPAGLSRNLGHEIDIVFGMKLTKRISIEVTSAIFSPGSAFVDSDSAMQIEAELEFTF